MEPKDAIQEAIEFNELRKKLILTMSEKPADVIRIELDKTLDKMFEGIKIELGESKHLLKLREIFGPTLESYVKLGAHEEDVAKYEQILITASNSADKIFSSATGMPGTSFVYRYVHHIMIDDLHAAMKISRGDPLYTGEILRA